MLLKFVDECLKPDTVFGRFAVRAARRHIADLKRQGTDGFPYVFDENAARRHLAEFPKMRLWKSARAKDKPFDLMPHFEFIIANVFGWKHAETGYRRFKQAYVELARKGAKSTLCGGMLAADMRLGDEPGAEYPSYATKRDQAKIVWLNARNLLRSHSDLKLLRNERNPIFQIGDDPEERIQFKQYEVLRLDTDAKIEYLGVRKDTLDGPDPYIAVIDELHQHPTPEVYEAVSTGMGGREQPLLFMISTAGFNLHGIGKQQRDYAAKILKGEIGDETYFAILFTLDVKADWPDLLTYEEHEQEKRKGVVTGRLEDDWRDENVWIKANPGLPYGAPMLDYLQARKKLAIGIPTQTNAFMTKHLSVWRVNSSSWLSIDDWDANNIKTICRKKIAYAGFDLAAVADLVSCVIAVPQGDCVVLDTLVWTCEGWIDDPLNNWAGLFRTWAEQGHVKIQSGMDMDFAQIRDDFAAHVKKKKYNVAALAVERGFSGHEFAFELDRAIGGKGINAVGRKCKTFAVGMHSLGFGIEMVESMVRAKKLRHGGNPVLRFAVSNTGIRVANDGRRKYLVKKGEKHDKIDPAVAMVLAIDRVFRHVSKRSYTKPKEEIE